MEVDRFLADWGGSLFAAASIVFLFKKSPWYWYASLGSNALWFYLFVETSAAMVAGLQVSYAIFAVYGLLRWRRVPDGSAATPLFDHVGTAIATAILALTVVVTTFDAWPSYLEFAAVALSILANWLTARKVIWCWPVWMATNVLFAVLFFHEALWGLFTMQFVFFALSIVGLAMWVRDARTAPRPVHA